MFEIRPIHQIIKLFSSDFKDGLEIEWINFVFSYSYSLTTKLKPKQ